MANMTLNLKIWRQKNSSTPGNLVPYTVSDINPDMSFLEMLDVLNEQIIKKGEEAIEFDNDCREEICGMCSLVVNGIPHGTQPKTASCMLRMRHFKDGDTVTIEPFRAKAFPVIKDLVVDRSAFDRIMAKGGYISINAGGAPDANALPIAKKLADLAMDSAECIGCGACVAACPNASAALFVGAKITQFTYLPQGQPERKMRAERMVVQMDEEGFGSCSNHAECEAACPKGISILNIAKMRREFTRTLFG
jgi:succinate dehydrogenase / fumarate reductase iron-sulfur subunit